MPPKNIIKYLEKNKQDRWNVELNGTEKYECIIVIPAIGEFKNIPALLESLLKNNKNYFDKTLIMFVVNNLESTSTEIKNDNTETIKLFRKIINKKIGAGELTDRIIKAGLQIAIVDAASPGKELPEKDGGVGLARKTGMDLALNYFDYDCNNKLILGCLDGDCTVSENYLEEIIENFNSRKIKAAYVNFYHPVKGDDESKAAIICYEIFLRYYVLALQYANSPFGFFTIGSTMFCDAESYVKVQGMNKRKAAEDFYFMEKLAKITDIKEINGTSIFPSGRGSWRVPFGTGQRVNRFLEGTHDEYSLYSLKSFTVLKDWLSVFMTDKNLSAEEYLTAAKKINVHLYEFLKINSFENNWNKILKNSQSDVQIFKQKKLWFDGFRTLKLIHYLRDNCFPNEPMFNLLDEVIKIYGRYIKLDSETKNLPAIEDQIIYLETLRELSVR